MINKIHVSGCIVTYNPDIKRLEENILSVLHQIEKLFIVDNHSSNIRDIEEFLSTFNNIELIKLEKNYGIAYALNKGCNIALINKFDYIITLDQDSVCTEDIISKYKENLSHDTGILHSKSNDRNISIADEKTQKIGDISKCITSASFINLKAWDLCGGFDEKLFIDSVDFDFCLMIQKYGFKIMRIDYIGFLHELGNSTKHKLLHRAIYVSNHSSFRRYYITRNRIYLARKFKQESFIYAVLKNNYSLILILLFERDKLSKIKSYIKGSFSGLFIKINYQDKGEH